MEKIPDSKLRLALNALEPHIKCWIEEKGYDALNSKNWWQQLQNIRNQHPNIGNALISLLAVLIKKWEPQSPVGELASDIAIDMPSELQRRLIDGLQTSDHYEKILCLLLETRFKSSLEWLSHYCSPKERQYYITTLFVLSEEEIEKFLCLDNADKKNFMEQKLRSVKSPRSRKEAKKNELAETISVIAQKIRKKYEKKGANNE